MDRWEDRFLPPLAPVSPAVKAQSACTKPIEAAREPEMIGFFVKHTYRGMGQIAEATGMQFVVRFLESGETVAFDRDAFAERDLVRTTLPLQSRCVSGGKECSIDKVDLATDPRDPNHYEVTFSTDGLRARLSEVGSIHRTISQRNTT